VLELTALPSIGDDRWIPLVQETDVLLVDGGDSLLGGPAYAIDDETAIQVTDGTVEVVSEGHWTLFTP
jgi:hypothetical protein